MKVSNKAVEEEFLHAPRSEIPHFDVRYIMNNNEPTAEVLELYSEFGHTAYLAQCLEIQVGTLLLLFHRIDNKISEQEVLSAFQASIDQLTLGNLLWKVREHIDFCETSWELIHKSLKKRNYLVHDFYLKNYEKFYSQVGREEMIQELSKIRNDIELSSSILESIYVVFIEELGSTKEEFEHYIQQETAKIIGSNKALERDSEPLRDSESLS
jgi:hypothetical protein